MRRLLPVLVLSAIAAIPTALPAQESIKSVLGDWQFAMETPRGSFTQMFTFRMDGDKLVGSVTSQMGSSDLKNVSFKDGTLSFQIERSFGGQTMTSSYTATIVGDEMKGTVSGGRGGEREFMATRKAG